MLDEPVTLVRYDRRWPERYAKERARLARALGAAAAGIEHFGSTAVPGLAAKPIVDILVGVRDLDGAGVADALADLRYEAFGEAGVPGRRYFRKRGRAAFNLALVSHVGEHWVSNLLLRDFLRASPSAAERYAASKRRALDAGAATLLAYSERKAPAIAALLGEARAWARDPANGFQLRPATLSDLDAITRVHIRSWQTTYRGHLPDAFLDGLSFGQRRAQWMFAATQADIRLTVASAAGQVIGFSCAGDNRDAAWPYDGELYALYLLEAWQGAGVGRALFDAAIAWLASRGKQSALLWALAVNRKARAFYEARGGTLVGEKPTEIDGTNYPEVAYGWHYS